MSKHRRLTLAAVLMCLGAALLWGGPFSQAKPPGGGGGVPPGTIYYDYSPGGNYAVGSVKADGSQNTAVNVKNYSPCHMLPSNKLHNGKRWFLRWDFEGETTNGITIRSLCVVQEDDPLEEKAIELLAAPGPDDTAFVCPDGGFIWWSADDQMITWAGHLLAADPVDGVFVDMGAAIYAMETPIDPATGLWMASPGPPEPVVTDEDLRHAETDPLPYFVYFDMTLDGSKIVVWSRHDETDPVTGNQTPVDHDLQVFTLPTETTPLQRTVLNGTAGCVWPAISPDGSKVAVSNAWEAIDVITLATGARTSLVRHAGATYRDLHWSPAGTHLVYHYYNRIGGFTNLRVTNNDYVIPVAGGGATCINKDQEGGPTRPLAWR